MPYNIEERKKKYDQLLIRAYNIKEKSVDFQKVLSNIKKYHIWLNGLMVGWYH
jgi:hypothetical protein